MLRILIIEPPWAGRDRVENYLIPLESGLYRADVFGILAKAGTGVTPGLLTLPRLLT